MAGLLREITTLSDLASLCLRDLQHPPTQAHDSESASTVTLKAKQLLHRMLLLPPSHATYKEHCDAVKCCNSKIQSSQCACCRIQAMRWPTCQDCQHKLDFQAVFVIAIIPSCNYQAVVGYRRC